MMRFYRISGPSFVAGLYVNERDKIAHCAPILASYQGWYFERFIRHAFAYPQRWKIQQLSANLNER
jgi:hypothetical protein